jgi:N-acetylglucosamine-6-sulfatase
VAGAIMAALREAGVADDTVVVHASDNGYSWGAHRWQMKQCPYEECMRVPLVVVYPRLGTEPRVETRIALNVDCAETLAALARVATSPDVEGRSLVQLIDGSAGAWRTDFLEEHWPKHGRGPRRTIPEFAQVRDTRWKYVEYADGETELYDEASDPWELSNLAADPAPIRAPQPTERKRRCNES